MMLTNFYAFTFRSIYHFDPCNLPPCTKLQIPNTSPANTPSPTLSLNENSNVSLQKKNHNKSINVDTDVTVVVQRTADVCDRDNVSNAVAIREEKNGACQPDIEVLSELEVILPEPTTNISMNSMLSPINQIYQEPQDNNLDRKADGMQMLLFFSFSSIFQHINYESHSF